MASTQGSSQSPRQNDTRFFSNNFLVTIYSSAHGSVVARVPEEFIIQLQSEWDTPLLSSEAGFVETAVQQLGRSIKIQYASAHVWTGSSPTEITLPLEFYAERNPKLEVVEPIVRLARMALPSGGQGRGFFKPPGPRIIDVEKFGIDNIANDQITISVGKFLKFTQVVVTNVNPTFITRDMGKAGYPLRATCEIVFRSLFSLTGEDLAEMFNDVNMGTQQKKN